MHDNLRKFDKNQENRGFSQIQSGFFLRHCLFHFSSEANGNFKKDSVTNKFNNHDCISGFCI